MTNLRGIFNLCKPNKSGVPHTTDRYFISFSETPWLKERQVLSSVLRYINTNINWFQFKSIKLLYLAKDIALWCSWYDHSICTQGEHINTVHNLQASSQEIHSYKSIHKWKRFLRLACNHFALWIVKFSCVVSWSCFAYQEILVMAVKVSCH